MYKSAVGTAVSLLILVHERCVYFVYFSFSSIPMSLFPIHTSQTSTSLLACVYVASCIMISASIVQRVWCRPAESPLKAAEDVDYLSPEAAGPHPVTL